jgi:hypothetical protein
MNETPRTAPPHFVPTLTEVVLPDPVPAQTALPAEFASLLDGWPVGPNTSQPTAPVLAASRVEGLAPGMVERILLRVELSLASRLHETVDAVLEDHMRALKAALRTQLSAVVLEAVNQAVRQETETSRPDSPAR